MAANVLTKIVGLTDNISPTGVQYRVVHVPHNNALWKITTDSGSIPAAMAGFYTSAAGAQQVLTQFLLQRWNESDEISSKLKSKRSA